MADSSYARQLAIFPVTIGAASVYSRSLADPFV